MNWLWRLRRRPRGEAGESLIELVISVTIMSIAVVAVVGALATAVRTSDMHRKQATAGAAVRAFAEALQARVANGGYVDATCATDASYDGTYTAPTNFVADVTAVQFWSPSTSTFVASCPDVGIQLVTIEVATSPDRVVVERLDVVLRKPCRVGDVPCA